MEEIKVKWSLWGPSKPWPKRGGIFWIDVRLMPMPSVRPTSGDYVCSRTSKVEMWLLSLTMVIPEL